MSFDQQAQDWDKDPKKIERAQIIAREIKDFIQPNQKLEAFEFGCGTGLLSYYLKDHFKTITLADTSSGMIDVLQQKIQKEKLHHFKPLLIDVLSDAIPKKKYDVVYTLMTMHHIPDTKKILQIFHSMIKPGGFLCLADLEKEDGSFHSQIPDFVGHLGFDRVELGLLLKQNDFGVEYDEICYEIVRNKEGRERSYPMFLMMAKKI
jgi:2-polyprenyl-3-methyl-5-hydroxy-6-metoxy-1,4-benzoquinol methylase